MFNAREARALAERAIETPAALLAAKTAILQAAEAGKFTTVAKFPSPVRIANGGQTPGLSDCIRLLKEQGQGAWAEAASQCNLAGYTVTPSREGTGSGQFALTGLVLRWDSPRSPAAGALVMPAEMAHRIAEAADRAASWARPLLEEVQRIAAAGRKEHLVRDPLPTSDGAWDGRLAYLRGLDFQVDLKPFGQRTELTLSW